MQYSIFQSGEGRHLGPAPRRRPRYPRGDFDPERAPHGGGAQADVEASLPRVPQGAKGREEVIFLKKYKKTSLELTHFLRKCAVKAKKCKSDVRAFRLEQISARFALIFFFCRKIEIYFFLFFQCLQVLPLPLAALLEKVRG